MFKKYLPDLPVKNRFEIAPFIPAELLKELEKGIARRNKIAHAGHDVSRNVVDKILRAIRDVIYLLDFYSGHDWAVDRISHHTQGLIDSRVRGQKEPTHECTA